MKKKRLNLVLIIVLLAVLIAAGVFAALKVLNKSEETVAEEKDSKIVQLLSFDSYEEITGTKIRLENEFGNIDVNRDKKFITEGEGSMAVFPQGDYNRPTWNPYMMLDCRDTTMATSDFTEFQKVTMDVYNSSEEEKQIAVYFTIGNYSETFMDTPTVIYTLAPGEWTECVYDIEKDIVSSYFNLANVRYMKIVFPDHKEAKDDVIDALYFDNLRATKYDVLPEVSPLDYDFYEGVSFEDIAEQYLLTGETANENKMGLNRVPYSEAGIEPLEGFGEYVMVTDVTGQIWPSFFARYGKEIPKDTMLTFWAYVEVEQDESDSYYVYSYTNGHGTDRVANTAAADYKFNQWVEVKVLLNGKSDVSYITFNFDDFTTSAGDYRFGDKEAKIYMDNFKLEAVAPAVEVDEAGNVTLRNPVGAQTINYSIDKAFKKGQTVAFDIDFTTKEKLGIWILADGKWNTPEEKNELRAEIFETWDGKRMFMVEIDRDVTSLMVSIQYMGEGSYEDNVCTISNIRTVPSRAQVQANGDIVIKNPAGDKNYTYKFEKPVKKGERIAFTIDFTTKEAVAVWLLAEGQWEDDMWYGYGYDTWDGKKQIVVEAKRDISFFAIQFQYRGNEDYTKNVCTISDVRIAGADASVSADGTVTLKNPLGTQSVMYDFAKPVKKGQRIAFDIDFNTKEALAIWLLAEGKWNVDNEINMWYEYGYDKWDGKQTIVVEAMRDISFFTVQAQYRGEGDYTKNVCTISNLRILNDDASVGVDGTVTIVNQLGDKNVMYNFDTPVQKGQRIAFDIDFNTDKALAIWLLAEGKWNLDEEINVWYEYGYDNWDGKKTIVVEAARDIDNFTVQAQYRGDEDYTKNVCTISNVRIVNPDASVAPDGTVTITNELGNPSYSYSFEKSVKKGQRIAFDIDFTTDKALAVWLLAEGQWEEDMWYGYGYDAWTGKQTIVAEAKRDIEFFTIQFEYRGQEDYSDNTATISNVRIIDPDASVAPDGTVTINNPFGNKTITYDFTQEVKKGQTITFDIDFNTDQALAVWVLAEGNWEADMWYEYGYDNWTKKETITATANRDITFFKVRVDYRGTEDWSQNVCTISNLEIQDPVVTPPAANTITITGLGDNGAQDGDLKRYLVRLNGLTAAQITGIHGKQAVVYVDGVQKTGAEYYDLGGQIALLLPYSVLEDGNKTLASQLSAHTIVLKAGTVVGDYTIATDFTFNVNQYSIAEGAASNPNAITITGLGDNGAQDGDLKRYLVRLNGLTAAQITGIHGKPAVVYVDGVQKTGAEYYDLGGQIALLLPYSVLEDGNKTLASQLSAHTIVLKAGTVVGDYTIAADFTFNVNQYSVAEGTASNANAITITSLGECGAQDGDLKRYLIRLNGLTAAQVTGIHGQRAVVYVDGVQKTGAEYYDLGGQIALLLPYSVLEDGNKTLASQLSEHTIVLKEGTVVGDYTIAADFAINVNQYGIEQGASAVQSTIQLAQMSRMATKSYLTSEMQQLMLFA